MKSKIFRGVVLTIIMTLAFSSCQQEGVYTPQKKLSKIFEQEEGKTRTLVQTWDWDNNLLSRINYTQEGTYIQFNYDGKRLVSISGSDASKLTVTYDGNKIAKIETFTYGTLETRSTFSHDGRKVSKIFVEDFTYDYKKKASDNHLLSAFMLVLSGNIDMANHFEQTVQEMQRNNSKGSNNYTVEYTYDGNNVIMERVVSTVETLYEYSHDNKLSPFYHLIHGGYEDTGYGLSKNNVTKLIISGNDFYITIDYNHIYDGNYPIEKNCIYRMNTYSTSYTIYYEYE